MAILDFNFLYYLHIHERSKIAFKKVNAEHQQHSQNGMRKLVGQWNRSEKKHMYGSQIKFTASSRKLPLLKIFSSRRISGRKTVRKVPQAAHENDEIAKDSRPGQNLRKLVVVYLVQSMMVWLCIPIQSPLEKGNLFCDWSRSPYCPLYHILDRWRFVFRKYALVL